MLRIPVLLLLLLAFQASFLASCDMAKSWQLEKAVKEALAKDQRTADDVFEVSADSHGVVNITGNVVSPEERDAVTLIAKAVPGVTQVMNNTSITEPSNGMLQDTVINEPYL